MAPVAEKLRLLMSLAAFKALRAFDMRVMRIDVEVGRLFSHPGHRPVGDFALRRLPGIFSAPCADRRMAKRDPPVMRATERGRLRNDMFRT